VNTRKHKNICKDCNGNSLCEHGKLKYRCIGCEGSSFCEHMKRKVVVKTVIFNYIL
jgi:hypothetical protein